ncbi:MAG: Rpn family recombination-promoting nuclease/putative transposase [Prevotella sp.]|nr:Rpn family recombination-promoting nuclease/putative transposase [Prevotella sp.]
MEQNVLTFCSIFCIIISENRYDNEQRCNFGKTEYNIQENFYLKENEDLLHDFWASLFEIPYNFIQRIDVFNSDVLLETAKGKFSSMYLKLLVNNRPINVEMQISAKYGFKDRVLYYWSKMYSSEEYCKLKF